jgi:hypothetical protein
LLWKIALLSSTETIQCCPKTNLKAAKTQEQVLVHTREDGGAEKEDSESHIFPKAFYRNLSPNAPSARAKNYARAKKTTPPKYMRGTIYLTWPSSSRGKYHVKVSENHTVKKNGSQT